MAPQVQKCPFCGRVAREDESKPKQTVFGSVWIYLTCGHTLIQDAIKIESFAEMVSKDGRRPYPYQVETADFAERANLNYICGHEMGLGKTVIECILLKRHLEELKPTLIVCKSGLRMQMWTELFRWTGQLAQIIESSNDRIEWDMFDIFIISFDTLRLIRPVKSKLEEQLLEDIPEELDANVRLMKGLRGKRGGRAKTWSDEDCRKFKHIVIDETQKIKNPAAARTQSLRDIYAAASKDEMGRPITPPRVSGYSGTIIDNKPSEFWTLLNMVAPHLFPYYDAFCRNHVMYSAVTGKEIGLKDPERFHELIAPFFIRFKREIALPNLPKINRMFQLADMESSFMEVYKRTVKEFQEFMDIAERSPSATDLLGWFARMRHISGMAKVNRAVDFIEEFLLSTDRKIVIFLHHKEVAKALMEKLTKNMEEGAFAPPLNLHAGLDMRARHDLLEEFKDPRNRVMIASQLAAGEGLNMQFCSDCLMMERQWNPSIEEQCEARFPRPGSEASVVNVWYLIADGTIDEFLTEMVEQKRATKAQVLDKENVNWSESDLIRDLADALHKKGLRKFMDQTKKRKAS